MKKRDLMVLAKRLSVVELFSLDIETTGLDRYRDKIVSVQISYDFNGKEYDHFIWWEQYTKEEWQAFLKAIAKLNMVTIMVSLIFCSYMFTQEYSWSFTWIHRCWLMSLVK